MMLHMTTPQAIFVRRALTPREEIADAVIVVEGQKIVAVGPRDKVAIPAGATRREAHGLTIVPGFVDVHIHGAGGHDVMEGTSEALAAITRTVARHGTTSLRSHHRHRQRRAHLPGRCRHRGLDAFRACGAAATRAQAEILGVHFEGPFISAARRGVHPPEWIAPPSVDLFEKFRQAAAGAARILTLAPELPGALDLIAAACAKQDA